MLKNRKITIGISGSIAAYKIATLVSMLKKAEADITVIMTRNATEFITPVTLETLSGNKVLLDTFDRNFDFNVKHVSLAKSTELFLLAPASANIIAKIAHGLADDMLTTSFLACHCPKIISPAMNTHMYDNPILQDNLDICRKYGMVVLEPATGYLACGDTGRGKMPEPEDLYNAILTTLGLTNPPSGSSKEHTGQIACKTAENQPLLTQAACQELSDSPSTPLKDLGGKHIVITAGPTREALDPVRFISNHSTGKMGYALARAALDRGARVTLISGPTALPPVEGAQMLNVVSARDMAEAAFSLQDEMDIFIGSAAVADYRPAVVASEKIKKKDSSLTITLEKNPDIIASLGKNKKPGQILVGFAMETENMLENASEKLHKKNLDLIIANNLKEKGAGFATDTNIVTIVSPSSTEKLPLLSKDEVANAILDKILAL